MKQNLFLLTYLAFPIFCCCGSKKEHQNKGVAAINAKEEVQNPIQINLPEKGKRDLNVSFFADTIVYIPLETNENSFLRQVTNVRMDDSIIVISDMRRILLFRHDGTFMRQIGHRGNGPKEYGAIANCQLYKDTIYVAHKDLISKYTLDGQFQGAKKLPHPPGFFTLTPDGAIALYSEYDGKVYFYGPAFNLKETLVVENSVFSDRSKFTIFDPADLFFQISKDKLLFSNYKSDTIWDLSGAKKKIAYILDLKDKLLPRDKQVEYFKRDFKYFQKAAEPYQKVNLKEISDYLFILQKSWGTGKLNTIYVHNLVKNTTDAFNSDYIYDDLIGNIKLQARPSFSTEDAFITAIKATELIESLEGLNNKDPINDAKHLSWRVRMSKVKYDDNPILVIIRPKKSKG